MTLLVVVDTQRGRGHERQVALARPLCPERWREGALKPLLALSAVAPWTAERLPQKLALVQEPVLRRLDNGRRNAYRPWRLWRAVAVVGFA